MRILIVEDHADLSQALKRQLVGLGMIADCVTSLSEARDFVEAYSYSLALIDRRLPDGDGLSLLPFMRRTQTGLRIIILTALDSLTDKVSGLDAGADDYLTKPFEPDELMARIRACVRRPGGDPAPPIILGNLKFDPSSREVTVAGTPLIMRHRELALLEALMNRAGRVALRDALMEEVYGARADIHWNRLNVHVSQLRHHLKQSGAKIDIHSARNIGYFIKQSDA